MLLVENRRAFALLAAALLHVRSARAAEDSAFANSCYVCKSADTLECSAEFHKGDFSKFEADCNSKELKPAGKGTEWTPIGCRKSVQTVEGETRVVRQCAYSGDDTEGVRRTGSDGIVSWHYQCSNSDNCNGGEKIGVGLTALVLSAIYHVLA